MGKLTDTRIRTAKAESNDLWLTDDMHVRGAGRLVLRVKLGASKLFYYRYTGTDGKRAHYAIGPYKSDGDGLASFTLDQARTRCAELVKIRTDHGDVHGISMRRNVSARDSAGNRPNPRRGLHSWRSPNPSADCWSSTSST